MSCDGFQKGYDFQLEIFYLITEMVLNVTRAVNLKKEYYPSLFLIIYGGRIFFVGPSHVYVKNLNTNL